MSTITDYEDCKSATYKAGLLVECIARACNIESPEDVKLDKELDQATTQRQRMQVYIRSGPYSEVREKALWRYFGHAHAKSEYLRLIGMTLVGSEIWKSATASYVISFLGDKLDLLKTRADYERAGKELGLPVEYIAWACNIESPEDVKLDKELDQATTQRQRMQVYIRSAPYSRVREKALEHYLYHAHTELEYMYLIGITLVGSKIWKSAVHSYMHKRGVKSDPFQN